MANVASEPEALIAWLAAHRAPLQLRDLTTPPDNAHSDAVGREAVRSTTLSIEPLSRAFLCARGDACGQMSASTRPAPKSPTESRSQTQGLVVASGTGSMLPVKAFQHGHVSRIGGPHIPGWMK